MKIRCLIENNETPFFISEHGLSLLIEYNNKKILFDTGKTNSFLNNAKKLNINLSDIDYLVLSHAHYDHTGGVIDFIKENNYKNSVFVGNNFKANKYSLEEGNFIYKGIPFDIKELKNINYVNDYLKVDDLYLLNNFKELNSFEKINDKFYILDKDYIKDLFTDELVLAIDTPSGIILFVGCSHVGIVNIINQVKDRLNKRIRGVVGGFHLSTYSDEYATKIIKKLKEFDLDFICPIHCSGHEKLFKQEFKNKCKMLYSGDLFSVDEVKKEYNMKKNKALDDLYGEQTDRNYKDGDRN